MRKAGFAPFVPALDLLLGVINGDLGEEDFRETGMEFLEVCDAMLVVSWSWGVQKEIEEAWRLGIPIYYSLEELYGSGIRGTYS